MKNLLYLLLLNTIFSYSQSLTQEKDFYSYSIDHYNNWLETIVDDKILNFSCLNNLYYVYKDIPRENLPNEIEGNKINYIDLNNNEDLKLINGKICTAYIRPMNINGDTITIILYLTTITHENGKYYFANGDFKFIRFIYSCLETKWISSHEIKEYKE